MFLSQWVPLSDSSSAAEARREGARIAALLGLNETKSGEAAIVITEAARNAVVYGGGGQLVLAGTRSSHETRMDIMALDKGPGIADLTRALQDGYSTGGTPGTGLGAIRRLADVFDVFSNNKGTALFARIAQSEPSQESRSAVDFSGFTAPYPGESACGDNIAWEINGDRCIVLVVDGLGHGPQAAEAADEAVRIFKSYSSDPPAEIISRLHDALKKARGAAAAVAEIRPLAGTLIYAGVGNIAGSILSNTLSRSLVSHNGTLGHVMARVQEFKTEWPKDGILIMHSDGLQSRWDLSRYPGILARQPALIAGVLLRDFRRERDDASVLVMKGAAAV
ncbi:MAG TPA: SpoIIE family protein phosphatase [Verrucomicrobiae bacterium]|nr:SpoIIE family protein phosphatase [Verrucomicrobiae bacterium]